MSTEATLREAIQSRRPLVLGYRGGAARTVHPHALYRTPAGARYVAALQVAGPSTSGGPLPAWRQFELARITALAPLAGRFEIAPDFDPTADRYRHDPLAIVAP